MKTSEAFIKIILEALLRGEKIIFGRNYFCVTVVLNVTVACGMKVRFFIHCSDFSRHITFYIITLSPLINLNI